MAARLPRSFPPRAAIPETDQETMIVATLPRIRGKRRIGLTAIVVVVAGAAGFFALQTFSAGEPAEAVADEVAAEVEEAEDEVKVPVALAAARVVDLPDFYHTTGTMEARRSVDLNARAAGQITRLVVEEGDWVEKGDVLLEIDPREQKLLVEEARVNSETAKLELARMENMAERGLETDRALEEARQAHQVNEAMLELARVRLSDHFLRAPFSGRVTLRHVDLGQTIEAGAATLALADVNPMQVKLFLPEKIVRRLAVGQPVEVRCDVDEDTVFESVLERIAPVVDAATSTVKVTLRVDDPAARDRSGSFIRARVTTDVHQDVIAVPRKALVSEAGATFLFVAEADSVRRVDVETGYTDGDWIEVFAGVDDGQDVVIVGQGGLRNGSRIEQLPDAAATPDETEPTELARN
jgi:RND family efflux transporter MFP subunit